MSFEQIAVIGGGAWGTALALTCGRAGRAVSLWEADPANAAHLAVHRESRFLPGVRLDDRIAKALQHLKPSQNLDDRWIEQLESEGE